MSDLDLIRELEELIGKKLEEVDEGRFEINHKNIIEENIVNEDAYALSKQGDVIGLCLIDVDDDKLLRFNLPRFKKIRSLFLREKNFKSLSFLKEFEQLKALALGTTLTDVSFLKELTELTILLLDGDNLTDASFLKELTELTILVLSGNNLTDVSFLKELTELTFLGLSGNNLTDVSFLKELTELTILVLSGNNLTDVSFLKELTELTFLGLSGNNLTDVSFVKELKGLTNLYLYLDSNQLTDVSFLKELKGLTYLDLGSNQLTDVSFLKELKGLTNLDLNNNQLTDVSFLKELKGLTNLDLGSNQLTDVSFLKELKGLTSLDLDNNKLTDFSFLKELKGLTNLSLGFNELTDVSFLKELKGLTNLYLGSNQLTDVSFLKELKGLTYLNLGSNQLTDVSFLKELKGLTYLNLGSNQLTDISFLKELKGLTYLNLGSNQLTDISFLKELKGLTNLDLNNNQLTDVSFLKELKGLTSLDLNNNQLTDASFLKELKGLTSLNLNNNQLTDVSFLKELKGLTYLYLGSNQLTDVSFLKELKGLTNLYLNNNELTDVSFLKELKGLTNLGLGDNKLTDFSFLKELKGLTYLDLGDNKLTDFSFLKELKGLTYLDLNNNELTDASFLKELKGLTYLNLGSNQLTDISFLKELKGLTYLKLSFNQIKQIPLWLTEKGLEIQTDREYAWDCINLYKNPIETPPIEIARQGNAAIRNYYAQLAAQGKDHLYEAKMLILGEGESGKTTLAHKIENPDCPLPHIDDRTRGITINRHPYSVKDKKNNQQSQTFHLNIWDFGGQEIYHATHRFFLSKRSLYLLVADNRKDDTDFNYWLHIIERFAGDSPLIILLNEKDDLKRHIDQTQLRSRDPDRIKKILAVNLKTHEETDSQKRDDRLNKIRQLISEIEHQAYSLPLIGEPVPARWLDVRQAIENDPRNQIYREQFDQLCHDSTITNPEDITTLLGYFHDIGVVLHFADNPHLANRVILKPGWATNAIYRLFDHDVIKAKQGRFSRHDCIKIWNDDQYRHLHDVLIELMKNFRLVYEIGDTGNLVAPRMLPSDTPDYPWDTTQNQLQFRYDFFMPKGIFEQLVVILYRYIENHDWVWRNGAILQRDGAKAEIIENIFERQIYIRFAGKNIAELRAIIIDELDAINGSYHKLNYEKMIPCCCDQCSSQSEPHFFKYSTLRKRQERGNKPTIECEISEEDVLIRSLLDGFNIHITDNFRENKLMKIIKIFLASSSELKADREQFEIFINHKNKDYIKKGMFLELVLWEDFVDAMSATRLQDEYNKAITDCDIFVSLFHSKVGKYTKEEFVTALATFRTHAKPWIYTYFKDEAVKLSEKKRDDVVSLYDFQEELRNLGHFHTTYNNIEDLKYKFSEQLNKILS